MKVLPLVASALLSSALASFGQVIIGNLGHTPASNASPQSNFWLAQGFFTGSSASTIGSVTIRGAKHSTQTSNVIFLYSDDGGGNIDSQLYAFDASSMTTTVSEQTFAITSGSGALLGSTRYWLVFAPDNLNTALWSQTSSSGPTDGSGVIPFARQFSGDGGSSWNSLSVSSALMFELQAVPEPESYGSIFGLLAFSAVAMMRSRSNN